MPPFYDPEKDEEASKSDVCQQSTGIEGNVLVGELLQ
jgi:hypothetical protein